MMQWVDVHDSQRVVAVAYDSKQEVIYVRFPDGSAWWYGGCPPHVWEEFTSPGTSKGRFIKDSLDAHPNGKWSG
jgi:hypothetical protein